MDAVGTADPQLLRHCIRACPADPQLLHCCEQALSCSPAARPPQQGHTVGGMTGRLFIVMRGFRAALPSRSLGCLKFPRIPSCWAECAGMILLSCRVPVPLRISKCTHFSFVPGEPAVGTCSQILLFHFPGILHTVQFVCNPGADY